ncbi:MAG: MmgE/PrpD family protein [Acidimicrobiia bacterium]
MTDNAATFFDQIATWVEALSHDAIPVDARRNAERAILDLLGVSIAGTTHELAAHLGQYLETSGLTADPACGLIGRSERASAEGATLYNAAIGHVLDFDDSSDTLGGHPTVVMLPALLAISETRTVTGAEMVTAYVAGVEVAAHIANQVNIAHYERGWHPTATLGIFGCAAACAKLLGLDAPGIARALSIASASPSGLRAHFGSHMKSVQVGEAARSGLRSALLAGAGIAGHPAAFEHEQGFGAVYNGEDGFRSEPFDSSSTRRWDIIEPGLVVKQYPCCASAHPAIDAALDLRDQISDVSDIDQIRIRLHPRRLRHTNNPQPSTALQGKFSVQYLVATALCTGGITLGDFTPEAMGRRDVGQLLDRLHAEPFPPEEYGPDHYAGEVMLTLADGSTLRRRVEKARGRGTEFALSDREVIGKFRACAEPVLGDARIDAILDAVNSLATMNDVRELVDLATGTPT